jgi:hypothetical protein
MLYNRHRNLHRVQITTHIITIPTEKYNKVTQQFDFLYNTNNLKIYSMFTSQELTTFSGQTLGEPCLDLDYRGDLLQRSDW